MKKSNVVMEGDSEVKKEGEMTVSDSDTAAPAVALQPTRHPLENAWTFCFDNPLAKSRQAVWGSSIRPVYTFSSVEDFWRSQKERMEKTRGTFTETVDCLISKISFHCQQHLDLFLRNSMRILSLPRRPAVFLQEPFQIGRKVNYPKTTPSQKGRNSFKKDTMKRRGWSAVISRYH